MKVTAVAAERSCHQENLPRNTEKVQDPLEHLTIIFVELRDLLEQETGEGEG
jgi:hypothetical protein